MGSDTKRSFGYGFMGQEYPEHERLPCPLRRPCSSGMKDPSAPRGRGGPIGSGTESGDGANSTFSLRSRPCFGGGALLSRWRYA